MGEKFVDSILIIIWAASKVLRSTTICESIEEFENEGEVTNTLAKTEDK